MAELQLQHVYKKYGKDSLAVDNFNLHVQDKEFIVFVGPSGCGKSTTLRMIAGLESITEGELLINGDRANDLPSKDRDIAMVFQNYALYPHLTVYDNMAFGLQLRKVSKREIDDRVREAARILDLEPYLKRKPKALSGGQRQRVALGRAIVRNAQIFLMDEPLSNLDAKLRVQMRAEISKLHQRLQTTIIYVTHDQTEAMTMASRIVVMKDGKIQQIGSPMQVYNAPENTFVASFIGSPGMNFFTGKVVNSKLHISEHEFQLTENQMHSLHEKGYNNQFITVGIRPEHIMRASSDVLSISLPVDVSELLGAEYILYGSLGDQPFVTKIPGDEHIQVHQYFPFHFQMNHAHFFDQASTNRIKIDQ
ncbi:ABC transporter ATP-binding protein [Priestia aryabhattai]|uniref:ABC transporter ATP-binding protein n=1 Tax=Priestia megaterium TaxID=1404 RepID=UPI0039B8D43B